MAYTTLKTSNAIPNFLASEIGLITKTVQVDATGITADTEGKKIIKAGTIYPSNNTNAKGIIFEDVDVTNGERAAAVIVAGRILKEKLPTAPQTAAETALKASGIVFDTEPTVYRAETKPKDYTAGILAFEASDIATNADGLTLTITKIGDDIDTSIATAALSANKVTCTKVKAGTTQITCTVTDSIGCTTDIVVPVVIA